MTPIDWMRPVHTVESILLYSTEIKTYQCGAGGMAKVVSLAASLTA